MKNKLRIIFVLLLVALWFLFAIGCQKEIVKEPPQWISTDLSGVGYYMSDNQNDRYFAIRYQIGGKEKEDGLGWSTEGWTKEKAYKVLQIRRKEIEADTGEQLPTSQNEGPKITEDGIIELVVRDFFRNEENQYKYYRSYSYLILTEDFNTLTDVSKRRKYCAAAKAFWGFKDVITERNYETERKHFAVFYAPLKQDKDEENSAITKEIDEKNRPESAEDLLKNKYYYNWAERLANNLEDLNGRKWTQNKLEISIVVYPKPLYLSGNIKMDDIVVLSFAEDQPHVIANDIRRFKKTIRVTKTNNLDKTPLWVDRNSFLRVFRRFLASLGEIVPEELPGLAYAEDFSCD
jgi:hypothetical protein